MPAGNRSVSSASGMARSVVTLTATISASPSFSGAGFHGLPSVPYHLRSTLIWLKSGSRSEEHTSELQSLMRISYAVFCLKKKKTQNNTLLQNNTKDINSIYHNR